MIWDKNKAIKLEYNHLNLPEKIYEDTTDNLSDLFVLDYILNPEGKIDLATATPEYHYHLKDHLGNTRVVFNGEGTAGRETDYYPFGMTSRMSTLSGENKYLFNGKELQDDQLGGVNLDWND